MVAEFITFARVAEIQKTSSLPEKTFTSAADATKLLSFVKDSLKG
jgi:hypothetical protein